VNEVTKAKGPNLVPGRWLANLAFGLRLSGVEWRIVSLVLAVARPLTTRRIAKYLRLEYTHAKRGVRSLIAWKILQRSPDGLVFQSDYRLWGDPTSQSSDGIATGTNVGPSGATRRVAVS